MLKIPKKKNSNKGVYALARISLERRGKIQSPRVQLHTSLT